MVGAAGIYPDDDLSKCHYELTANQFYGEKSLHKPQIREANVLAHRVTVCLSLSRSDYEDSVVHIEHLQCLQRIDFLQTLPALQDWSLQSVSRLNSVCRQ